MLPDAQKKSNYGFNNVVAQAGEPPADAPKTDVSLKSDARPRDDNPADES
jgi:hypothetical protein